MIFESSVRPFSITHSSTSSMSARTRILGHMVDSRFYLSRRKIALFLPLCVMAVALRQRICQPSRQCVPGTPSFAASVAPTLTSSSLSSAQLMSTTAVSSLQGSSSTTSMFSHQRWRMLAVPSLNDHQQWPLQTCRRQEASRMQ